MERSITETPQCTSAAAACKPAVVVMTPDDDQASILTSPSSLSKNTTDTDTDNAPGPALDAVVRNAAASTGSHVDDAEPSPQAVVTDPNSLDQHLNVTATNNLKFDRFLIMKHVD